MSSVQKMPGDTGLPLLANLYVDGMPLWALNAALALNKARVAAQREAQEQGFWSTPPRANTNRTREVMEVSLSSVQRINLIQLSLAHFPHRAWIQYLDETGTWQTMKQASGMYASVSIEESIPMIVSSGVSSSSKVHYQHFGAGHWVPYRFKVEPVTTNRIRVVLARIPANNVPINTLKQKVEYCLGVKDLSIGYEASSPSDVPVVTRSGDVPTESSVIASSTDILGSSVDYVVRQNRATDLLAGRGVWKCSPQPLATAVVNLYVDARDSQGNPQVVDKFFMDPLHTGSTVNLYYSLEEPNPQVFPASDTPLAFPFTRPFGAASSTSADDGILFPTTTSFLDIDNKAVQFDPTQPFQLGMQVQPQFPSTDTGNWVIYDDGVLKIFFGPDPSGTVTTSVFQVSLGSILLSWPGLMFDFNARLRFVLAFDGSDLTLHTPLPITGEDESFVDITETDGEDGVTITETVTFSDGDGESRFVSITSMSGEIIPGTVRPSVLRIGGSLTDDPTQATPANARLVSMYIKEGNPDGIEEFKNYWTAPSSFVVTPEYPRGKQTTDNAILRYDPKHRTDGVDSLNPYGFLGGPGVVYEEVNWTPIGRDYQLKKGFYEFDPTRARFFKFEFSNLIAEPYETDAPVVLTAKIFAKNQQALSALAKATADSPNTGGYGILANVEKAVVNRFDDQNRLTTNGTQAVAPTNTTTYLPTEAQYVKDPQGAALMASAAPYWNFTKHQPAPTMPRQSGSGKHYYETVTVETNKRVAYFVGLSKIVMYRLNSQIADDTDQFLELFHDTNNLDLDNGDITNWSLGEGSIFTPSSVGQLLTLSSKPLNSFRVIRGLQFATTQSPPKQLLTDPDFDDVSLQYWQPLGDAKIEPDPYFNTDVGSLVKITRAGEPVTYGSMEDLGTWNQIEDSDPNPYLPTWESISGKILVGSQGGIQSFEPLEVSPIGKLYAAARILAPQSLSAPVVLQLINGDGSVLAQESATASAGQIVEWSVEYNIGTGGVPDGTRLWTDVEALAANWDGMDAIGTWNDVAAGTADRDIFDVKVQLFQDQATDDVFYVDNISVFNDAIMWEFSRDGGQTFWPVWDIRNDPNGVFLFPDGDEQDVTGGSALVWRVTGAAPDLSVTALQIRPWFESVMMGMPAKYTVQKGGPNLSPLDQNPDVTDDPMFKVWHNAIPQDWWYIYRQWLRSQITPTPVPQRSFLPDTVPEGVNEGSPEAPDTSIMPSSFVYTGS
jgi:hypothetical protein